MKSAGCGGACEDTMRDMCVRMLLLGGMDNLPTCLPGYMPKYAIQCNNSPAANATQLPRTRRSHEPQPHCLCTYNVPSISQPSIPSHMRCPRLQRRQISMSSPVSKQPTVRPTPSMAPTASAKTLYPQLGNAALRRSSLDLVWVVHRRIASHRIASFPCTCNANLNPITSATKSNARMSKNSRTLLLTMYNSPLLFFVRDYITASHAPP